MCHPIDSLLGTSQWSNKSEQFFFLMDPFKNESVMIGDLHELENTSSQPDECVSVSRYLILPLLDETNQKLGLFSGTPTPASDQGPFEL